MECAENNLVNQCIRLVSESLEKMQTISMNVKVGGHFCFEFSNHDFSIVNRKKNLSPSQKQRNYERKRNFFKNQNKELVKTGLLQEMAEIHTTTNCETQTDNLAMTNNETQTDHHFTDNAASNTDIVEIQSLEDELKVDEKGVINCNEGESLNEMCISHDVRS